MQLQTPSARPAAQSLSKYQILSFWHLLANAQDCSPGFTGLYPDVRNDVLLYKSDSVAPPNSSSSPPTSSPSFYDHSIFSLHFRGWFPPTIITITFFQHFYSTPTLDMFTIQKIFLLAFTLLNCSSHCYPAPHSR